MGKLKTETDNAKRTLRSDLQLLRRKGAIKINGGSLDRPIIELKSSCARCRLVFGYINRGAECISCRFRVCRDCRVSLPHTNNDWVCIVCCKEMEFKAASGEWISEFAREVPRCDQYSNEYLPSSEVIRNSIRRSWTISNSHQVHKNHSNANRNGGSGDVHSGFASAPMNSYDSSEYIYNTNNRTNQTISYAQHPNMDYQNNEYYEGTSPQRRVLRQSTLPTNLPHADQYPYQNNMNLMPPVSPNQQISPQYSPYNTDNEDMLDSSNPDLHQRRPIRRQSTLPSRPSDHYYQQQQQQQQQGYFSTSPNRNYSRSPEKSDSEQQLRYPPPFVRQSTFPSNASNEQFNPHRPKILPTSPNRMSYNKSPEHCSEPDFQKRAIFSRQNTLPNPDQQSHGKLLPTSPPKRQLSPQYKKRSPEMIRQQTLPNPDGMNSLNIPQTGKFLPISPRMKQNFLFPQPVQNPRQFLSQQNVPLVADDPYSSTGSVRCIPREQQVKMMKVRSHSNEEYSASRTNAVEGRRLLPEIPKNRSRSPSRLVRQDNVKDENRMNEQKSPNKRTFGEAKQNLPEYDDMNQMNVYNDGMYGSENTFLEADEDDSLEALQYQHYYDNDDMPPHQIGGPNVRSVESYLNDSLPEYSPPDDSARYGRRDRPRRRRSRDLTESESMPSSNDDDHRRKPETMRSISEDTPTRTVKQAVTRRTLSHPEKESQSQNQKIPSPKPLSEVIERSKREKPSPRRKNYKSIDIPDTSPTGIRNNLHMQKRDSKSFDSGTSYRSQFDDGSADAIGNANDSKTSLPSTPARASLISATNQSVDENATTGDRSRYGLNNVDNGSGSDNNKGDDDENKHSENTNEHKTTLGEAEIQSAVEAAAVIFKKVVLQRRKEAAQKATDEVDRKSHNAPPFMQDDFSDYENFAALKMICPESDDYKLVFISSDSSGLDEDSSSTSSSNNHHSISLDDCDWDYFEPSATTTTKTIFRDFSQSPFASPNVRRRPINISDTTDEELLAQSSSPTSSDHGFVDIRRKLSRFKRTFRHSMNKNNVCSSSRDRCDCGHANTTQYVPIPVVVPIPVPMAAYQSLQNWKPGDLLMGDDANSKNVRAIQKKQAAELFHLWNSSAPELLIAHQQQSNYAHAEQQQQKTTPTHMPGTNTCVGIGVEVDASQKQENDIQQQKVEVITLVNSATCSGSNGSSSNNYNHRNNTCISAHNDRQEQASNFSTGQTVDSKTAINALRTSTITAATATTATTAFEADKFTLNRSDGKEKSRHFVLNSDVGRLAKSNSNGCDGADVSFEEQDKFDSSKQLCAKSDEFTRKANNKTKAIDQDKITGLQNPISDLSTKKIKSNVTTNDSDGVNSEKVLNKHCADLSKCSATANSSTKQSNQMNFASSASADVNANVSNMTGYLRSESAFSSSASSSDVSDDDEDINNRNSAANTSGKASIKRNYDVLSAMAKSTKENQRNSINLVSGSSDCEDLLSSSAREQPSSSAPEASDSEDETVTKKSNSLIDRRPKSKGFFKVFVVNKKNDSSSDSQSSNGNSTDDSTDNDTDTEQDCGIVLNYVKPLSENCVEINNDVDGTTTESLDDIDHSNDEIVLCSIKRIDEDDAMNGEQQNRNDLSNETQTIQNETSKLFLENAAATNETIFDCNKCSKSSSSGNSSDHTDDSSEQSGEDENEQTVIEQAASKYDLLLNEYVEEEAKELESSASLKRSEMVLVNKTEPIDLHDQSSTAIDNDNSTCVVRLHDLCAAVEHDTNAINEVIDNRAVQSARHEQGTASELEKIDELCKITDNGSEKRSEMSANDVPSDAALLGLSENGAIPREFREIETTAMVTNENLVLSANEEDTHTSPTSDGSKASTVINAIVNEEGDEKNNRQYDSMPFMQDDKDEEFSGDDDCDDKAANYRYNYRVDEAKVDVVSPDKTSFDANDGECSAEPKSIAHSTTPIESTVVNAMQQNDKAEPQKTAEKNEFVENEKELVKNKQSVQDNSADAEEIVDRSNAIDALSSIQLCDRGAFDFPSSAAHTQAAHATNTFEGMPGEQTITPHSMTTTEPQVGEYANTVAMVYGERSPSVENELSNSAVTPTKYTSLVMITQDIRTPLATSNVNVVPTDTTHIVSDSDSDSIIVQHTNRLSDDEYEANSLAGYFTRSLEEDSFSTSTPTIKRRPIVTNHHQSNGENLSSVDSVLSSDSVNNQVAHNNSDESMKSSDAVTVVTGKNTLSAVISLEEGLADDDSWVGSADEDEEFAATDSDAELAEELAMCQAIDREEELRGYNRASIDFTLHTIVEESCEESEVETNVDKKKNRMSASELEKYFFFGLGDGKSSNFSNDTREDSISETSSLCSEGMDNIPDEPSADTNSMVSSRLEKYFLSTFMGFSSSERDKESDNSSGSVGSDSEGHASPEQRRKRLVRARGTPRSHNSSLDNLLAAKDENSHDVNSSNDNPTLNDSNHSSETDTCDETVIHLEKDANPNDTLKRKKQNKKKCSDSEENRKSVGGISEDENAATAKNSIPSDSYSIASGSSCSTSQKKHGSRDSGFIGSNDDLLKSDDAHKITAEMKTELEEIKEETKDCAAQQSNYPPSSTLTRKDSFNNYSSDEETNLMMSKLRQFVKTLVASNANAKTTSKSSTPLMSESSTPKTGTPVPKPRSKAKPPQLVYFENELTRLMKTVPGINDDQVREIVEYLSSEETWSDSYDSSDYTSSDLEGAASSTSKSELQEQISASCQQIIKKFEGSVGDREGDIGDGGLFEESQGLNRETALVYHKLMQSFSKIGTVEKEQKDVNHSPPIFAKVMSHIGTRLVALMHEVSSGDSHTSQSPQPSTRYHHKKLQQKISATTTDEDEEDDANTCDSLLESAENYLNLPRSKSHDLLLSGARLQHHQSSSGVSDTAAEEKEASDYERFSWRGSFESALLANGDSRTKLTLLDRDNSSSASALAAKRRSAGDLLFNQCSLSREQLDRVRSCGSIGGGGNGDSNDAVNNMETSKLWGSETSQRTGKHRNNIHDSDDDTSDEERRNHHLMGNRSTLPRSLQSTTQSASTNSLPRLSTSNAQSQMQKSQSAYQFLPNNVKSARYRPPGFTRTTAVPKKANSSLGLSSLYTKRDNTRTRRLQAIYNEGVSSPEAGKSPIIGSRNNDASPTTPKSPARLSTKQSPTKTDTWPAQSDEDIDRLVAIHQNRSSLSSLGLRSDSMASVYSGAGDGRYGTVTVKGQIEFGMQYNYKQGALEIYIAQCKDLAAVDSKRNRSDPYVKVYLLPDKSKNGKRKTKVKKHTLNPIFDETLKYYMTLNSLESRTLWVTVWHSDMFGRNDFLGEVTINLQGKVFDNPQPQWYTLQERSEPFDDISTYRGDIIVGLKFVPPDSKSSHFSRSSISSGLRKFGSIKSSPSSRSSSGTLHVLVKEAKNLSPVKANGTCDAFCKSYLLPDKNRNSKQKTPVVKRSVNPTWNYTFAYDDVSLNELSERALELTIWDHDRLASNEFLGGVRFSLGTGKHYTKSVDWMDSTGKELSLWQSMINRPNFWVEGCVALRSTLDNAGFTS